MKILSRSGFEFDIFGNPWMRRFEQNRNVLAKGAGQEIAEQPGRADQWSGRLKKFQAMCYTEMDRYNCE
jgi:hypothetical protein